MKLLLLRLEGPLQSWGERAKWDKVRDTALMPTKSGVVGLLAACMGILRQDERLHQLSKELAMSVRADRRGSLSSDFHTAQGRPCLLNAEGKKRSGGNTIVTNRAYLEDASFLVVLEGEEACLNACYAALCSPVWPPYLGRKSCVPTKPICLGLTEAYKDAREALLQEPLAENHDDIIRAEITSNTGAFQRMDEIDEGDRRFRKRKVNLEVLACT